MFWKKKKDKGKDPFDISFDLDRRNYFRIQPPPERKLSFKTSQKTYQVHDISAGGLALKGRSGLQGKQIPGLILMPSGENPVPVVLAVLNYIEPKDITTHEFSKMKESDRERIHQFVLDCQKRELERKKEADLAEARSRDMPPKK